MPTIIDSLLVTLGLDDRNLNRQAAPATKKIKDIETQANRTESSMAALTKTLTGFLAVIGGTVAIKRFVIDTIDANAALDRLSKNLSLSTATISAWGNAVEEVGGSSKNLQGSMDMLSRAQTELRLTGQSSLIPYLSALGVSLAGVGGQARPVDEILLDLADRFSRMNRTTANNMGRMMGLDQDTLNLLLRGRHEVELTIARQKEFNAVSKQQAETASRLQRSIVDVRQSFAAFGRDLLQQASPAIERILDGLMKLGNWARENQEFLKDFFIVIGTGLAGLAIASAPLDLVVVGVLALAAAIALLWQDYQTWKRGGDSLIDWEKWETGINKGVKAIEWLKTKATDAFQAIAHEALGVMNVINGNWAAAKNQFSKSDNSVRSMVGAAPEPVHNAPNAPETGSAKSFQKYFMDRGWSAEQAAGIAANLMAESGGRSNASGDNGSAFGIGQWHKDRQDAFAKFTGHNIQLSTLTEQLAFVQHELSQGDERAAGRALRGSTTANGAAAVISKMYERPADAFGEATRRGRLADSIMGIKGAAGTVAGVGSPSGASGSKVSNSFGDIAIYTQATDAQGIAKDFQKSLDYLLTSQANSGLN